MDYQKISKGLRLVFFGELIEVIGVIGAILLAAAGSVSGWLGAGAVILVFSVVAGILSIKGLVDAGKTEQHFSSAWQTLVGLLLAEVLVGLLAAIPFTSSLFSGGLSETVILIADLTATLQVLKGIQACYEAKGMQKNIGFAKFTGILFIIKMALGIFGNIYTVMLSENAAAQNVFALVYLVVITLTYAIWLVCLGKAFTKIGK